MSISGKPIYGSSTFRISIAFAGRPSPTTKGTVRFYERDHLAKEINFSSFSKLVEAVKKFWEEKTTTEIYDRRLASWFAEYFEENGMGELSSYTILEWIKGASEQATALIHDQSNAEESTIPVATYEKSPFQEQANPSMQEEEPSRADKKQFVSTAKSETELVEEAIAEKPEKSQEQPQLLTSDDMVREVLRKVKASSSSSSKKKRQGTRKPRKRTPRKR